MKKLFLTAVICALFTPAFAGIDQGIDTGMTHLSVLGGFAVPVNEYGSGANKADYGDIGVTYGAQIIHHLTPYFGLGIEANGTNYGKTDVTVSGNKVKYSADKYAFFVAGKINFAPEAKTRFYIPFGAGFVQFKGKMDNLEEKNSKPALFAGVGVESDLNDIFIWGFEARYNHWFMDDSKFKDTKNLSDVAVLLKLGVKL